MSVLKKIKDFPRPFFYAACFSIFFLLLYSLAVPKAYAACTGTALAADTANDPASATISPGAATTTVGSFSFKSSGGGCAGDTVTALTVSLANSGTPYNGLLNVTITNSTGATQYFNAITSFSGNTLSFSGGTSIPVTNTIATFRIMVKALSSTSMPAVPGASYAINATTTGWTGTLNKSGSDTNAGTITIDNTSPNDATGVSATGGTGQVALAWTNSNSSDFSQTVILRNTASISDVPQEGTTYTAGNTIGASTVVYVGSGTSSTDTSNLVANTTYYYKVFSKDTSGNYSTPGVQVSATPTYYNISGTLYSDELGTVISSTRTVKMSINGYGTMSTTTISGAFTFSTTTVPTAGMPIVIYISGAAEKGATVLRAPSSGPITGLDIYQNRLRLMSSSGSVTNANIGQWDKDNDATDLFFTSNSNVLSVDSGFKLNVTSGVTYAPGGNVIVDSLKITGTYSGGSETLTLAGSGAGIDCSAAPGTVEPLCIAGGTFTPSTNTVNFTGTSATTIATTTFNALGIGTTADSNAVTYTLAGNATTSTLVLGNAASGATDTFNPSSYILAITGSGAAVTPTTKALFSASSGTVKYTSTSNMTIASTTYYNLVLDPSSAGSPTYTFAAGTASINSNLTIGNGNTVTISTNTNNPTINVSGNLTINSSGTLSGSGTGTITVNGDVTGTGIISLTAGTFEQRVITEKNFGTTGGSNNWTFNNLTFSNSNAASHTITTQTGGSGTVTISGALLVGKSGDGASANTVLNAGNRTWTMSGSGGVTLLANPAASITPSTSTFDYEYNGAVSFSGTYYNLKCGSTNTSNATACSLSANTTVSNILTVGAASGGADSFSPNGNVLTLSGTSTPLSIGAVGSLTASGEVDYIGADSNYDIGVAGANYNILGLGTTADDVVMTYRLDGNATASSVTIGNAASSVSDAFWTNGKTFVVTGSGTPVNITAQGLLIATTGTFKYTSTSNTTIASTTYATLLLQPSGAGSPTYTFQAGTTTVSTQLTIGDGTNTASTTLATNNSILDINGNLTISAKGELKGGSSAPIYIGGSMTNSGTFVANSGTVTFDATATGKTISGMGATNPFYNLVFNGTGSWSNSNALVVSNDLTMTAGTFNANNNVTVNGGDVTGNGTISYTSGTPTFLVDGTGNFGSTANSWVFNNLTFGDGIGVATTSTISNYGHNITVDSVLTLSTNQVLKGSNPSDTSTTWHLTGAGTPFLINGSFVPEYSTISYNSTVGANIARATYYSLVFFHCSSSPTFIFPSGITSFTYMNRGYCNTGAKTLDLATNNASLNILDSGSNDAEFDLLPNDTLLRATTGTITFVSGEPKYISGFGQDFGKVLFDTNTTLLTDITISSTTIATSKTLTLDGKTLTLTGTTTPLTINGSLDTSSGTVEFAPGDTSGVTIPSTTYYNLKLNKSGNTFSSAGAITVNNNIDITAGTFVAPSSMTVGGNWTNSGTFTHNSGTVTFGGGCGASNCYLSGNLTGTSAFNNVVVNPATNDLLVDSNIDINGNLTVNSGAYFDDGAAITATVKGGNVTGDGVLGFNTPGTTFLVDGTGNFGGQNNWFFYNLTFGDGVGVATTTAVQGGNNDYGFSVSNLLTVSANQVLDSGSNYWRLTGANTPFVLNGSFVSNTSNFIYSPLNGTAATTTLADYYSLLIYNNSCSAGSSTVHFSSGFYNIGIGGITIGSCTVNSSIVADLSSNNPNINLTGSLTINTNQTFTKGTGVLTFVATSTAATITDNTASRQDLGNVVMNNNVNLGSDVKMSSTTIASGKTLTFGGNTLTLTGTTTPLTVNGSLDTSSGTVEFAPGDTSGVTIPSTTYYNLKLNKSGNTFSSAGTIIVNNNIDITAGTFVAPPSMTVGGNWTNSGTFSANSGTVTLASSTLVSIINGATTFNNIVSTAAGKVIKFAAQSSGAPVFTIAGTLTLTGTAQSPITLRSNTPGTQWLPHFNNSQSGTITYVNIYDSGCHGGSAHVTLDETTVNGGGNDNACWIFYISPGGPSFGGGSDNGNPTESGSGGGSGNGNGSGQGGGGGNASP
jgi:hypothetical protein